MRNWKDLPPVTHRSGHPSSNSHYQSKFRQPFWGKGRLHRPGHPPLSTQNQSIFHQPFWGRRGWFQRSGHPSPSGYKQSKFDQSFWGEEVRQSIGISCFSEFLNVLIHSSIFHYYLGQGHYVFGAFCLSGCVSAQLRKYYLYYFHEI